MKTKRIMVCSLEDAAHDMELFDYMAENQIPDIIDFFCDTEADKLQLDGNIILFTRIETLQSDIIIYWDSNYESDENQIKEILSRFFSPDFRDYFEKRFSIWSEFQNDCIAFRDGKGDMYTIWKYSHYEIRQNGKTVLKSDSNHLFMIFKNLTGLNVKSENYRKYLEFAKQSFQPGNIEYVKNGLTIQTGIIP